MLSISPNLGILALDTSSSGSLYRSGSGSIAVSNGDIMVDSANASGALGSGSGNVSAANIYLHGNVSNSGSGNFLGNIFTGVSPLSDPLVSLPTPTAPAAAYYSPVVNGTSITLSPGTYVGRIQIEGNAHVTLQPGLYYLEAGLSISGGTLTGSGVTLFDASNSIDISGSSSVSLSAPTSGQYQGVALFQSRSDNRPIAISGTPTVNLIGEVYTPDAQLQLGGGHTSVSGNGSTVSGAVIVKDLDVSGSGNLTVAANASRPSGDLSITKTDNLGGSSITSSEGLATAGGSIVYTITVANAGPSAAVAATVTDAFPSSITGDTFTVDATGGAVDLTHSSGSGAINDSVYLPTGSTITYTVTAHISASATGLITNSASVTAPAFFTDTCAANNTASDTDSLLKADLAVSDTDSKTTAVSGTQNVYTIVVTNNGPNAVTGATVKDLLAANADVVSDTFTVTATGGAADTTNAAAGSGSIDDTVNMPAGSTLTYHVTANLLASATGTLTNTATVATPSNVADPVSTNNSATDSDTLTPQSNLLITNCDSGHGTIVPGTQVTYTIAVKNCGPSDVVDATIADALPAGISSDTYTAVGTSGASGFTTSGSGDIDDTSVDLTAGACITYTVSANVAPSATGTLSDTATVKAGRGETNTNPNESGGYTSATDATTLTPNVDLIVTNADSVGGSSAGGGMAGVAIPGNHLTYTITVQNTGPSNAAGVTVVDALPAGITSDTFIATGTSGASGFTASGSGNIDDTAVSLASGSTITYTVSGAISAASTGNLSNSASATAGSGETNTNPHEAGGATTATDADTLFPQVDLAVTATDNDGGSSGGLATTGNVVPGGAVTYTIVVQNSGPSNAVGVAVADTLPAGITSDTYTAHGTAGTSGFTASGTGNIDDTAVDLAAGSSITYTVTAYVGVAATGSLSNSATATVGSGETNIDANEVAGVTTATDSDNLTSQINLVVTKVESGFGSAVPGGQIVYMITVTNAGPSDAVDATVADSFPVGIASDSYTASGTAGASGFSASGTGNIDDTMVDLVPGASVTYAVMANISSSVTGTLTNTATATVGSGETNIYPTQIGGTTSAVDSESLSPDVDLVVVKNDDGGGSSAGVTGNIVPGSTVTYTITVENAGPSDAVGVAVADSLPAGITSDTFTAVGSAGTSGFTTSGSGNISDSAVNIASGASITYTVVANVDPSATGSLSNTATATAGSGETNSNANQAGGTTSATDTDNLTPQVDLVVTKTDDGGGSSAGVTGNVSAGGVVTYTITVQNAGPSNAAGVAVADALPAGITSDTFTASGTPGTSGFTASGSGYISDSVSLAVGGSITYTVTANIDPAIGGGSLSNTATATIGSGETNTNPGQSGGITSATDIDTVS